MTFTIIYSYQGTQVKLEMDNLSEALEIVGTGRILTITKSLIIEQV